MENMSPIQSSSPEKPQKIAFPSFAEPNNDFSTPEAEPEPKPKKHNFMGGVTQNLDQSSEATPVSETQEKQIHLFDNMNYSDENEEPSPKSF